MIGFKKTLCIMHFLMIILVLSSCSSVNLDVKIKDFMGDDCNCEHNYCECTDKFTDDNIFVDCRMLEREVTSLVDILSNCQYTTVVDGEEFGKGVVKTVEVEKIVEVEKPCPSCPVCKECEECPECEGCEECEECPECDEECRDFCYTCNKECFDMCDEYCEDCYSCPECDECSDDCEYVCDNYCEDCYEFNECDECTGRCNSMCEEYCDKCLG